MATQTVYFNNPADITTLQNQTSTLNSTVTSMSGSVASLTYGNNWTRGQFVSSDLIYTIPANCWTGPVPSLQGPAQPVSVYRVVYYSSDSTTSSVQRVSATVYVPQTISKTGSMVLNIKGLQPGNNSACIGWETYSNPTLQGGLTLAAANAIPKFDPSNPADATFGVIFPSTYAIEAGLGYITTDADGFGLGVSQNDCVLNYMSQINPQVDLLRCLRNMYTSGISTQKALFGNAIYNGSSFPVTVSGYSLGGIIAPGVVNEFSAGVSAIIPSAEASAFNFKRILCGAVPDGQNQFSLIANTQIGNYIINPSLLLLYSQVGGNQPTHPLFAQPEALSTYWPFWTDIDQKANFTQDITSLGTMLAYSLAVAPPSATYLYNPPSFGGPFGLTGADIRQLYKPEYTGSFGRILKNLHGWANPNRPLYTLPSCGVSHLYSTLDEVVCPYGYTGGAAFLYGNVGVITQQAGYNFDCASALDKYMTVGDVSLPYYNFTGAGKTKSVSEVSYASDATFGITTATTAVYTATVSPTSNNYLRVPVDLNFVGTLALADHGGFTLYYQSVINAVLATLTNAN